MPLLFLLTLTLLVVSSQKWGVLNKIVIKLAIKTTTLIYKNEHATYENGSK